MDTTKITLRNAQVIFVSLKDEGFGRSITIDATGKETKDAITKWVVDNNIGKNDKAGKPNFKDYEGKQQYQFKMNDNTRFAGLNGLSEKDLGFGSQISLTANAFEYNNKFGQGIGSSLSAVVVERRSPTSSDADLEELLGDAPKEDVIPQADSIVEGEPVDLSEIPY